MLVSHTVEVPEVIRAQMSLAQQAQMQVDAYRRDFALSLALQMFGSRGGPPPMQSFLMAPFCMSASSHIIASWQDQCPGGLDKERSELSE